MPGKLETATDAAEAEAAAPLELLLISDQIGSSQITMVRLRHHVKRHFIELLKCVSSFTDTVEEPASALIIKNIGDSLMINIKCSVDVLPRLLEMIIDTQERLMTIDMGEKIGLRVLIMSLAGKNRYYVPGEKIFQTEDEDYDDYPRYANRVRGANGTLEGWLEGDLFGPKINLAFRAANISTDKPILIIEDSLVEHLPREEENKSETFTLDAPKSTLRIGERLAFTPVKGLENQYIPCEINELHGWYGHLFLRAVTRDTGTRRSLEPLALEQQRYKCFTRFMWSGDPDDDDLDEWVNRVQDFQGSGLYFRNLLKVVREGEIHRARWDELPSEDQGSPAVFVLKPEASRVWTGFLGVFAGPFESTYETLRSRIFEERDILGESTRFRYVISTNVYDKGEAHRPFWDEQKDRSRWHVFVFWRWLPQHRQNNNKQGQPFIDDVARKCMQPGELRPLRVGVIAGGEWDGYAILQPIKEARNLIEQPVALVTAFDTFLARLEAYVARPQGQVESAAVYFCCEPNIAVEEFEGLEQNELSKTASQL